MENKHLRIALVGYGKMGKAVEIEAKQRNHEISSIIDLDNESSWSEVQKNHTEVIIEFTQPKSFEQNLRKSLELGIPMVSGTTGWYERLAEVTTWVNSQKGSLLYASNFSIGVNILFQLNKRLAQLMNRYPEYDCFIEEQHHRYKSDAPSGTALHLGHQILHELSRKTHLSDASLSQRAIRDEELSVGYIRAGEIYGKHTVSYNSEIDTLSISHHAHNRRGFALGAVIAAEWLIGKKGVYEFSTLFD